MTYFGPGGQVWPLIQSGVSSSVVRLADEGIDGLVSSGETVSVSSVGRAGVVPVATQVGAMTGTLRVVCVGDDDRSPQQIYQLWRSSWSRTTHGMLLVDGGALGEVSCRVRLAEWMPPPARQPGRASHVLCEVPVVCDDGVWWSRDVAHSGLAQIANPGITYVWPRISWNGPGGTVTLPSGATFDLPDVDGDRTMHLDPDESCVVLRADGSVDEEAWRDVSAVGPEGVPPGGEATFQLPEQATLLTAIGWDSPWQ